MSKYVTRDKQFRELIRKTATITGQPISAVEQTVEFYLRTASQLVQLDLPVDVHIDYIGTLRANVKYMQKMAELKEERLHGNTTTND